MPTLKQSAINDVAHLSEYLERKKKKKKEEDIAPITQKEEDIAPIAQNEAAGEERTWFKKGAFDDGYQAGDITKTILGTAGDVGIGLGKGFGSLVEGVVDLVSYGEAAVADYFGNEEHADRVRKKAMENSTEQFLGGWEKAVDKYSVLGDKADAVTQGIGQVATIIATGGLAGAAGAGAIGATAATTGLMGASSFGSGMSEAYMGGATDEEAATYGLIKGVVDAGSEMIFGGFGKAVKAVGLSKGLSSLDDVLAKKISGKITNQIAKNFAEYGVKASAEGVEEVLAGIGSAMGKQATYMSEKELSELLADENLLEQFVVGAVTSGIAQSGVVPGMSEGSLKESIKTERDFISGLTENEQKVVDKEYENRIAEESKDRELSKKEKSKIYDEVLNDLEEGGISIDTIEEVLGGDSYKAYRDTVDSEDAKIKDLEAQIKELEDAPNTVGNSKKYDSLTSQLEELKNNSQRNQLKTQLGESVFGLAKDSKLAGSYNERSRRGQAFEADLTQYDAKQQEVIKKAVESGILNNTRRTHKFVDMIAKISADKGVLFDFTNNAKLKDSGFAIEGKTVNGFVTKDGVTLNIDSAKSLNSVVGHEITHVLEGTELYTELQSILKSYAETKGEYQSRYDSLTKLYEGVEGANVDAELTADLVGDYLFTDPDFINNLSTKHRNVFQKVYDEIKYLCKVVTAGSKESRQLEKVKRAFDNAYRGQKNAADGGTKYSIENVDGSLMPVVDTKNDTRNTDAAEAYLKTLVDTENVFATILQDAQPVYIGSDLPAEYRRSEYTAGMNSALRKVKMQAATNLDEMLLLANNGEWVENKKAKHNKDAQNGWYRYETEFAVPVMKYKDFDHYTVYSATLIIRNDADGKSYLYDMLDVKEKKKVFNSPVSGETKFESRPSSGDNVPQGEGDVKRKYSISDSDGKQLTKEQQEYFKDSKVRDENGNLKVMYHGSQDAGFHVFDAMFSDDDTSFFFTDRNDVAASYSGTTETYTARAFRTAEDFNKFFAETGKDEYSVKEEHHGNHRWFVLYEDGTEIASAETAQMLYDEFRDWEGVGYGDANYKVYLNLKNPLVVDAQGRNWDMAGVEWSQELADKYKSLTDLEKRALFETADWGDFSTFKGEVLDAVAYVSDSERNGGYIDSYSQALASAYEKVKIGNKVDMYYLYDVAFENFSDDAIEKYSYVWRNTREYAAKAKTEGYDGVIFKNIVDNGGYSNGSEGASTVAIAFDSNQIKSVANTNPTADPDIRYSLSEQDANPVRYGNYNVYGEDIALETAPVQETAPVSESEAETPVPKADVDAMLPDDLAPMTEEETEAMDEGRLASLEDADAPPEVEAPTYQTDTITVDDPFENRDMAEVGNRKVKAYMYENPEVKPFFQAEARAMLGELRDTTKGERWYNDHVYYETGGEHGWSGTKRHTSDDIAYLLDNLHYTYDQIEKGLNAIIEDNGAENNAVSKRIEFILNDRLRNGYMDFMSGIEVPPDQGYINLLNEKQITEYSKEAFDALMANADEYAPISEEIAGDIAPVAEAVPPAPPAPTVEEVKTGKNGEIVGQQGLWPESKVAEVMDTEPETKRKQRNWFVKAMASVADKGFVFENLSKKTKNRALEGKWNQTLNSKASAQWLMGNGTDGVKSLNAIREEVDRTGKTKQFYEYLYHMHNVDRMSLETEENRTKREGLKEKLKGYSEKQIESMAMQWIDRNTTKDAAERIKNAREYIDTLKGKNKPVFGESVTADVSRAAVKKYEAENPEFKDFAQDVYDYMNHLRKLMVDNGVVSQETADLWSKMYPHYVPIRRLGDEGLSVNVPLDTNRTGVNAPIKRAKGGNRDILPLFDTMAMRTEQTFKAIARNNFGVELMHTLDSVVESEADELISSFPNGIIPPETRVRAHDRDNFGTVKSYNETTGKYTVHFENEKGYKANVQLDAKQITPIAPNKQTSSNGIDEVIDNIDKQDGLLQEGKDGKSPTFTVFDGGKRVTFEITDDMYDALKPTSEGLAYTNKVANTASNIFRGLLTEYNPVFMATNAIKDAQDVFINSQHPLKTYMSVPKAIGQLVSKGKWYTEYMANGGEQNTYFDSESNTFTEDAKGIKKTIGIPLEKISEANNFIEKLPRLSEYIASRESGRSIEVSMLDAARVTTNFAAGGDVTKFLNRNGATFLNASVQGAMQQARNIREAKMNGLKGYMGLATKFALAGLPALVLNNLVWDDDEEYEELSDYVKQNYYVVGKFDDGKFVRIPKGRTLAVIQNGFTQMANLVTGDDEVDFASFLDLLVSNLAPNNPIENNILAPIMQVKNNETWYGEDLVPTRLQDLPAAEQYDESTDSLSKWIGETFDVSPYKVNYLLNQYSGGVGDVVLPMLTPEAESGDNTLLGNILAPAKDKFTTDSVMNNQNVSDFYDKVDELAVNANSSKATDEDVLMSKYMNSVSSEIGKLYGQKREIQNSDLPNNEKYNAVREVQRQIDAIAKESLNSYEDIQFYGDLAIVGDRYFKRNENGGWTKQSNDQVAKYQAVEEAGDSKYATDGENHWRYVGDEIDGEWRKLTDEQEEKQETYSKALNVSAEDYWRYYEEIGNFDAKDANGNTVRGLKKERVEDYIFNQLDIDYGAKCILFKSQGFAVDDSMNYDIIDYLNSRDDVSYSEMVTILEDLDFTVDSDGTIWW